MTSPGSGEGHTPGPWDCTGAQFPDDNMGGVYYRIQAEGMDMRAANARLIAAAPELLGAAEEMFAARSLLDNTPAHHGSAFDEALERHEQALTALRAAIAKATGKATP